MEAGAPVGPLGPRWGCGVGGGPELPRSLCPELPSTQGLMGPGIKHGVPPCDSPGLAPPTQQAPEEPTPGDPHHLLCTPPTPKITADCREQCLCCFQGCFAPRRRARVQANRWHKFYYEKIILEKIPGSLFWTPSAFPLPTTSHNRPGLGVELSQVPGKHKHPRIGLRRNSYLKALGAPGFHLAALVIPGGTGTLRILSPARPAWAGHSDC